MKFKFAVLGGGIGGLATAVALANAGQSVDVFERAPAIREVGAGLSLWPNATYALREIGVLDECLNKAHPFDRICVRRPDGKSLMNIPVGDYTTPAIAMHRADLVGVLQAKLSPGVLKLGQEVTGISETPEGAWLLIDSQGSSSSFGPYHAVIAADGLHSLARAYVRGSNADTPEYRGYPIWRGLLALDGSASDLVEDGTISESWGAGQRFGILAIGHGRIYWYATENQTLESASRPQDSQAHLLKIFASWHRPVREIIEKTSPSAILKNLTYDRKPLRGWGRGRVILLGDAAHPTTPNMGQGGCMALEDSVVLARLLNTHENPQEAFAEFEKRRFARTAGVVRQSRLIGDVGQWQNPLAVTLRDLSCALLPGQWYERLNQSLYGYKG